MFALGYFRGGDPLPVSAEQSRTPSSVAKAVVGSGFSR
jgi:hypothetical protein